jgi:hypothetical protein
MQRFGLLDLTMDCRVRGTPPRERGGDPTPGNDDA